MEGLRCLAGVPQLDHKGFIYRAFCLSWVRPVRWWDMGYMGLPHGNPEIHSKSIQIPWFIPWFIRQYQTCFFPVTSPFTKAKSEPWLCCTRWHKMRPLSIPDVKWSFCTGTVEVCSFCWCLHNWYPVHLSTGVLAFRAQRCLTTVMCLGFSWPFHTLYMCQNNSEHLLSFPLFPLPLCVSGLKAAACIGSCEQLHCLESSPSILFGSLSSCWSMLYINVYYA